MATQSQGTARPKASSQVAQPQVIIVGAGFGGLLLGILLEMANIEYQIFERGEEIRPIGKTTLLLQRTIHIQEVGSDIDTWNVGASFFYDVQVQS